MRPPLRTGLAALLALAATLPARGQDVEAGQRVFMKCRPCHQIGEGARNQIGPVLNGLVGRRAGTAEGYSYSPANRNSGLVWDEPTLREYIRDPKAKVPGTKMIFPGLPREKDVDDLVAYLRQFDPAGKKAP
jgi:cytochrome c